MQPSSQRLLILISPILLMMPIADDEDVIPQVGHAPGDMEQELAWLMDQNDGMDVEE